MTKFFSVAGGLPDRVLTAMNSLLERSGVGLVARGAVDPEDGLVWKEIGLAYRPGFNMTVDRSGLRWEPAETEGPTVKRSGWVAVSPQSEMIPFQAVRVNATLHQEELCGALRKSRRVVAAEGLPFEMNFRECEYCG